ncbi:MAG: hypothetical protein JWN52_4752 [Actinomycetia bacterium]|nr:hypothetical protein [Actinomycetes bacterium]
MGPQPIQWSLSEVWTAPEPTMRERPSSERRTWTMTVAPVGTLLGRTTKEPSLTGRSKIRCTWSRVGQGFLWYGTNGR